jgi:biopolymer transport protein ExbD
MKFAKAAELEKLEFNMTPMIDVCFQLIIFFMLSLRLFSPEGDFSVTMPLASPRPDLSDQRQALPVKVRLRADKKGDLVSIQMGQRMLGSFKELHKQIRETSGIDRGPAGTFSTAEVELDCDYNLKYKHIVDALTAISGFVADDRQTIVRMIEKIRFAPPRKPKK